MPFRVRFASHGRCKGGSLWMAVVPVGTLYPCVTSLRHGAPVVGNRIRMVTTTYAYLIILRICLFVKWLCKVFFRNLENVRNFSVFFEKCRRRLTGFRGFRTTINSSSRLAQVAARHRELDFLLLYGPHPPRMPHAGGPGQDLFPAFRHRPTGRAGRYSGRMKRRNASPVAALASFFGQPAPAG